MAGAPPAGRPLPSSVVSERRSSEEKKREHPPRAASRSRPQPAARGASPDNPSPLPLSRPSTRPRRTLMKPMFLAYSRKHWRQVLRSYLRMMPLLLPHTRLPRRRQVSARAQRAHVRVQPRAQRRTQRPRGGAALCAQAGTAAAAGCWLTHHSRPPLLWSFGWLFHTAANPCRSIGGPASGEARGTRHRHGSRQIHPAADQSAS